MIPGMGRGVNPRKMKMMMKKMGMEVDELEDVEEIIIRTAEKDYIFDDASVTIMTTHGQKTYQVVGEPRIVEKEGAISIPEEDIQIVMGQTGATHDNAKKALQDNGGNPAEAIISLLG